VAAVAWAAVEDAVYQTPRLTATTGRGLRGGTYKVKHGKAKTTITYRRARFSRDVAVSGAASLDIATSRLTGRITVAGALSGTLQLRATLWDPDKRNATIRGTLGGQRVALLAPAR
jgi:hypothetical protein